MEATGREIQRLLTSLFQGNWLVSCTTDCRVQHLCRCRMPGLDGRVLGCRQLRVRRMLVNSSGLICRLECSVLTLSNDVLVQVAAYSVTGSRQRSVSWSTQLGEKED